MVLIPKVKTMKCISEYWPISLCNVLLKVVTKLVTNRIKMAIPFIIFENQSVFVPGRLMSDNVVTVFDLIYSLKRKTGERKG